MADKQPRVSIIVPAYNAVGKIERCLRSIQNQTFSDFEALVIDDKSQDNTIDIVKSIIDGDKRFKLICLESNCGVAEVRNYGLSHFKGKYVSFVDSDDTIHPDFLKVMVDLAGKDNEVPLVSCRSYNCLNWKHVPTDWKIDGGAQAEYYPLNSNFDYNTHYCATCWGSLYRSDIVKNLKFDKSLFVGEDTLFWAQALIVARGFKLINLPLYCYVHYPESTLHGRFDEKRYSEIIAWEKVIELFNSNDNVDFTGKLKGTVYMQYSIRLHDKYYLDVSGKFRKKLRQKALRCYIVLLISPLSVKNKVGHFLFIVSPGLYKLSKKALNKEVICCS